MSQQMPVIVGDFGEDYGLIAPHRTLEAVADRDRDSRLPAASNMLGEARPRPRGHPTFDEIDPADYGALVPGEREPEYLRPYDIVPEWLAPFIHLLDAGSETRETAAADD